MHGGQEDFLRRALENILTRNAYADQLAVINSLQAKVVQGKPE